jgi:queuine tRNA-ribosyltransferase
MFSITTEQGTARTGILKTAHGEIETPAFLQVATKGNPKLITTGQMEAMGGQALICNSLLLHLKPGPEIINGVGGLHSFFGWNKPIFTDSGGFQSIAPNIFLGITDRGIRFKNPFTLEKMLLTPQNAMEIQNTLGADAIYCLDYMPPAQVETETLEESVARTTKWAAICKQEHRNKKQLLTGITQGGSDLKLRKQSSQELTEIGFDIHAIGGMGIGENPNELFAVVKVSKSVFPREKPVHLMGLGSPSDMVKAVGEGVDLFDSCYPTRMARHGAFFCGSEIKQITKKKFAYQKEGLVEGCACYTCTRHSAALIHHLFKVNEQNGPVLLSLHNVHSVLQLMKQCRETIAAGTFSSFQKEFGKT